MRILVVAPPPPAPILLTLFSQRAQEKLGSAGNEICRAYSLHDAVERIASGEKFDLVLCTEDLPACPQGQVVQYIGSSLIVLCRRRFQLLGKEAKVRVAMLIGQESPFFSNNEAHLNLNSQRGEEICYLFTREQLEDETLRSGIEMALFKMMPANM